LALFLKIRSGKALSLIEWNLLRKDLKSLQHPLLPKSNFSTFLLNRNSSKKPILWKEPNTHFFAEYLLQHYPTFKYIQLHRDGRKMAQSKNDQQFQKLNPDSIHLSEKEKQLAKLDFWLDKNETILRLKKNYTDRICIIRFEDLIQNPENTVLSLMEFLSLPKGPLILAKLEEQIIPEKASIIEFQILDISRQNRLKILGYE